MSYASEEPLVDINGVPFLQGSVFDQRKDVGLYLRITQQTKADIEHLCKVHDISQEQKRIRLRVKAQRNTWEAVAACLVIALAVK